MTRIMKTSWTEDDLRLLQDYIDRGYSVYRIAAALNRSVAGVRTMAQRIGVRIVTGSDLRKRAGMSASDAIR